MLRSPACRALSIKASGRGCIHDASLLPLDPRFHVSLDDVSKTLYATRNSTARHSETLLLSFQPLGEHRAGIDTSISSEQWTLCAHDLCRQFPSASQWQVSGRDSWHPTDSSYRSVSSQCLVVSPLCFAVDADASPRWCRRDLYHRQYDGTDMISLGASALWFSR